MGEVEVLRKRILYLEREVDGWSDLYRQSFTMTFWQRLKFLFTGKVGER